ncbi:glycosyltransferase [Alcanivorax sp. 1008]|uniref:glycosyltransferase n=1 Tax=Alcanivorax sp. 1008 TaxID=2816853 RepID=UPI001D58E988|nr:glycosyltransferase [Alcanivorax sp. 1008]MCC1495981.1 glycosyltransferase [Alcanivorax sp. 1008]
MLFCIFSFNRGQFLENCVASIEQCAPHARIAVFDDNSYDEYTRDVLKRIADKHAVIQPGHQSQRRLGGLYGNMQTALEYAADEDLVCYLQDDTQMVRPLTEQDMLAINALFDGDERIGFVSPCFLRGRNRQRDVSSMVFDSARQIYFRQGTRQSAGQNFSALLIMRPQRLLAKGWSFGRSEPENDRQAAALFGPMAYLKTPFAMWLPEVPTYRGKRKTLALKIAERQRRSGYFPFRILSDEDVTALRDRTPDVLPIAEDFLSCTDGDPKKPWAYHPMQDDRWLQKLSSVELALRRWFQRG